jgi:hypothetical protein
LQRRSAAEDLSVLCGASATSGTFALALALATIDATGTIGPPFHLEIMNGMRPAER